MRSRLLDPDPDLMMTDAGPSKTGAGTESELQLRQDEDKHPT
jgi:hypothetical protein